MTEANSINASTTGIVGNTGTSFTGTAVTAHNVILGGATSSTLTNVAPSATSGVPFISQGASADGTFGTAVVAGGGTGATSYNTNGAVISGTTSTAALAAVSLGNQQLLVGNTSAAPTAKSLSVVIQTFTGTGTYTPTSGMVYCIIELVGGGGGGGGVANSSAGQVAVASGGGAGGYSKGVFSASSIGASKSVTIGAAGTAGANTGAAGGTGGTTSVGATLIQATGGVGGNFTGSGTNMTAVGGSGGVGSLGSVNVQGNPGLTGYAYDNVAFGVCLGGGGGGSFYGGGAIATVGFSAQSGNAGTSYGAGGGGASSFNAAGAAAGGAGVAGFVEITEFVLS